MNPIDEILELLDRRGGADYGGERVSQLEHALQCAMLAEEAGAEATLISAALLHDVGHLVHDLGRAPASRGIDDRHELRGREWLSSRFGEAVKNPSAFTSTPSAI
jgi:predicted HD phosphohydrolase